MGIVMEAVDQHLDVLVEQGVVGNRIDPGAMLGRVRQLAVGQEIGDFQEGAPFGQFLDRIAAVAEDAALSVDEGDRASTARGVEEGRIVAHQTRTGPVAQDLLEVGGGDRAISDWDLVVTAGSVVGDGQRVLCHGYSTLSASSSA